MPVGSTWLERVCIIGGSSQSWFTLRAEVAELADALASGASGRKVVEVQILSSAPTFAHDQVRRLSRRLVPP